LRTPPISSSIEPVTSSTKTMSMLGIWRSALQATETERFSNPKTFISVIGIEVVAVPLSLPFASALALKLVPVAPKSAFWKLKLNIALARFCAVVS
jgi:hypothetical protein